MRVSKSVLLLILTIVLTAYYLLWALYLNHIGYYTLESLFYVEKAKIVFDGLGPRLKVMGLTTPIFPFYATFLFTIINYSLAPIIASAIGTGVLFNILGNSLLRRIDDGFYLAILFVIFAFHPGILYVACSGKAYYLVLIFFFLFYINIFKFYISNTTFHVSIASICLVILIFCEYKFIWLTLFFIPLVLSIALDSLNLSEKESIFRLFTSFNNPSLRRKLINKTFALYIILFILPLVSVLIYKILNLTHAADMNYFIESPYATWSVLAEKIDYSLLQDTNLHRRLPETSLIISLRAVIFCPLILVAIFMFRHKAFQLLTMFTPFALIEFLRVKYDKVYLTQQYYLMFMILALLCVIFRAASIKKQFSFKILLVVIVSFQFYTGWAFLERSYIRDEQTFVKVLTQKETPNDQDENEDIAHYINNLPGNPRLLLDDAVAYPIAAFVPNIQGLIMPYQGNFLSAVESPGKYASYILIAADTNPAKGFTQLTPEYLKILRDNNHHLIIDKKYETDNWILYKIDER